MGYQAQGEGGGRFGVQRVSGVPQITPGTYYRAYPAGIAFHFGVPHRMFTGDRQVIGGLSLASPSWRSRGHGHFFGNDSQL